MTTHREHLPTTRGSLITPERLGLHTGAGE